MSRVDDILRYLRQRGSQTALRAFTLRPPGSTLKPLTLGVALTATPPATLINVTPPTNPTRPPDNAGLPLRLNIAVLAILAILIAVTLLFFRPQVCVII
ncbi:MAG: hypothetical protein POG74_01675 [Acidocella sp.]|nr:hypothetical protein [Acidocella sp.]